MNVAILKTSYISSFYFLRCVWVWVWVWVWLAGVCVLSVQRQHRFSAGTPCGSQVGVRWSVFQDQCVSGYGDHTNLSIGDSSLAHARMPSSMHPLTP